MSKAFKYTLERLPLLENKFLVKESLCFSICRKIDVILIEVHYFSNLRTQNLSCKSLQGALLIMSPKSRKLRTKCKILQDFWSVSNQPLTIFVKKINFRCFTWFWISPWYPFLIAEFCIVWKLAFQVKTRNILSFQ